VRAVSPLAACVSCLCLAAAAASANDVPVFSSGTEVVRVDVSVQQDGRFVEGLQAPDFEVWDNGVPQTVEIVGDPRAAGPGKVIDVLLALDVSQSVEGEPLRQLKAAAHTLVDALRPEDSLSLLTFSSRVRLAVSPGDSRARAHEVIEATRAQLTTSLYDGAFAAIATADPSRGRSLALVLSDGTDHGSWLAPERVLRAAQRSDQVVVHIVQTHRAGSDPGFLRELAALTGGEVWRADYGRLGDVLLKALEEFRARYTLGYTRRGVLPSEWHDLDIRVRKGGARVRARSGYVDADARPPREGVDPSLGWRAPPK